MFGRVLWCTSVMMYPKNFCGLLCATQVCVVGCNAFLWRLPDFMKCAGNSFLYLLSGMVWNFASGSILARSDLLPCFIIICSIVWKEVCPSDVVSVRSLPSWLGVLKVMWLIWYASSAKFLRLCIELHVLRVRLLCSWVPLWYAGWRLLLVLGFLDQLIIPLIMSSNCFKALRISSVCLVALYLSFGLSWFDTLILFCWFDVHNGSCIWLGTSDGV